MQVPIESVEEVKRKFSKATFGSMSIPAPDDETSTDDDDENDDDDHDDDSIQSSTKRTERGRMLLLSRCVDRFNAYMRSLNQRIMPVPMANYIKNQLMETKLHIVRIHSLLKSFILTDITRLNA